MCTGDHRAAAEAVAKDCGIDKDRVAPWQRKVVLRCAQGQGHRAHRHLSSHHFLVPGSTSSACGQGAASEVLAEDRARSEDMLFTSPVLLGKCLQDVTVPNVPSWPWWETAP